jgi:hypothetical protein
MLTSSAICNVALGYLATAPIGTLGTDTTPQGVLCSAFYVSVKQQLLESRNWTFAKKTWAVTTLATPVAGDHPKWAGSYTVPTDCIRVHRVDDGSGLYDIEWERVGSRLFVSRKPTTLYVEGMDSTTAEASFSSAFDLALAASLAREICIPLTENATLWASMVKVAEFRTREAAGLDGSQGTSEVDNRQGNLSRWR